MEKCYVAIQNGKQFVFMPDGTKIPGQVWTRVYDPITGQSSATVQILVDLKPEHSSDGIDITTKEDHALGVNRFLNSDGSITEVQTRY